LAQQNDLGHKPDRDHRMIGHEEKLARATALARTPEHANIDGLSRDAEDCNRGCIDH